MSATAGTHTSMQLRASLTTFTLASAFWSGQIVSSSSSQAPAESERRGLGLEQATVFIETPSAWLPVVEERIRASVRPLDVNDGLTTEYLAVEAAWAAINFFRMGAAFLPTEPHIYATHQGDLVAEFETPDLQMTTVISKAEIILFAVLASDRDNPIQGVIQGVSKLVTAQLSTFMQKIDAVRHGKVAASR